MTRHRFAEQALALAWATRFEFPAAGLLLEEWASRELSEPDAPLTELSGILDISPQERREALLRLAHEAEPEAAARYLADFFENGLTMVGERSRCRGVFYNLMSFVRSFSLDMPLPGLPSVKARAEVILNRHGCGRDAAWESEPIRESESRDAVRELLQALTAGQL